MRVKTVPRHLPRKEGIPGLSKTKNATACASTELLLNKISDEKYPLHIKTVNFTNYHDMVQEMNLVVNQQSPLAANAFGKWRAGAGPSGGETEAVDLSRKGGSASLFVASPSIENNKLKDTYLYQIMTDPNLLSKIIREKQMPPAAPAPGPAALPVRKPSCCPYCKRDFGSESEVKRHLNVQADESSQLTCCACGKSFAQKRYLRYHQRCHSERNKFACELCTRKYSRLDNLTRHNIFHTNPDKFPCSYCERTFARKDLLNKHLKCHENKYKYHCDVCQKYFKGPVSLDNHMKSFHSAREPNNNNVESMSAPSQAKLNKSK